MNATAMLTQMPQPVIGGAQIRRDGQGRFSLNDLHRASGGESRHRPSLFLNNKNTKALITQVETQSRISCFVPIDSVKEGKVTATYAHEIVAIEYAGWISPAFRVLVNQTFIDSTRNTGITMPHSLPEALRMAADLAEQNQSLRAANAGYQRLTTGEGRYCFRDAAKMLNVRPCVLKQHLLSWKWIYLVNSKVKAYQRVLDARLLYCRMVHIETGSNIQTQQQVQITEKGIAAISKKLEQKSLTN